MKAEDFIAPPCACGECVQAGVSDQELRRDPHTGRWLHGYALKRWYEQRDAIFPKLRRMIGAKGRHAQGFEPLARKEQS